GRRSLPKKVAVAAGVPGAELIPETAQPFLRFTSTQRARIGPRRIANFQTLGYGGPRPSPHFKHRNPMPLSHLFEDREAWYLNFDFTERVETAFRPGLDVPQNTQTVAQGPRDVSSDARVKRQFRDTGRIGHSASIQTTSRLLQQYVAEDGTVYPKG